VTRDAGRGELGKTGHRRHPEPPLGRGGHLVEPCFGQRLLDLLNREQDPGFSPKRSRRDCQAHHRLRRASGGHGA
jgi:hypothetical protein